MKTKTIKGNLILTKDTIFEGNLIVEGNIQGYHNLKVNGNINARDITAWDIDAWNINAWNINAGNINACDIICEKRIKKAKYNKTIARVFIQDKSSLKRKEQLAGEVLK